MKKIIIAIDGYAGCGKSTTAKRVAEALNYIYIDTGAMYRAVTLFFIENQVDIESLQAVEEALAKIQIEFKRSPDSQENQTFLNHKNVSTLIRSMEVSQYVSLVSRIPQVRWEMVAQQQKMGMHKGIVMDGRDIGTQVFPEAELKIFMEADLSIRSKRRKMELAQQGEEISLDHIYQNLQERDQIDTTRSEGPLKKAEDALILDSSERSIEEQSQFVIQKALQMIQETSEKEC